MTSRWKDLGTRSISALILATAVLFITWWDAASFDAMLILAVLIVLREWFALTRSRNIGFLFIGLIYTALAAYSLTVLRHIYGWEIIYLLFGLVWVGDIAAYFTGRLLGKHKIAPNISPGKSWEGLAGSIVATCALSGWALAWHNHYLPTASAMLIGVGFAMLGLFGDLIESLLKRKAGVKDSGTLIPGHGGLFDRIDGLIPCAILAAVLLFFVY